MPQSDSAVRSDDGGAGEPERPPPMAAWERLVNHMTGGPDRRGQLHFQLKPSMVCGHATAHHRSSTLSTSKPEMTSNSSSSMLLCRKR
jgi:hypothetical protein